MTSISSIFQKLLIYFDRTIISISSVPLSLVRLVVFSLNLDKILLFLLAGKSIISLLLFKAGSSQYY